MFCLLLPKIVVKHPLNYQTINESLFVLCYSYFVEWLSPVPIHHPSCSDLMMDPPNSDDHSDVRCDVGCVGVGPAVAVGQILPVEFKTPLGSGKWEVGSAQYFTYRYTLQYRCTVFLTTEAFRSH